MGNYAIVEFGPEKQTGFGKMKINSALEDIQGLIDSLTEQIIQPHADFPTLKGLCFDLICRLPLPIQLMQDTFILRGRENFNGEVFSYAQDLSYNPDPSKVRLSRFNLEADSVFYGALPITSHNASGQVTSICEPCKELFDSESKNDLKYFTIGKWNILKPIRIVVLTFFEKAEETSWHLNNLNPNYIKFLSDFCTPEDLDKCSRFLSFFSGYAARKYDSENMYLLTTALFHALKEYYGPELGILYSSSMTENKGINIVLSKETLDASYLALEGVVMFKVTRDPKNFKTYMNAPCTDYAQAGEDGRFRFGYIT